MERIIVNWRKKRDRDQVIGEVSWKELFNRGYKKALGVGIVFALFQQGVGINIVMFYSTFIFDQKMTPIDSYILSGVIGVTNCFSTLITLNLIDYIGRKKISIVGSYAMCGLLVLLSIFDSLSYIWVSTVITILYVINFAYSLGPVLWIYLPEILPEKGLAFATSIQWVFTIAINVSTSYLMEFSRLFTLLLFAGFALGSAIFCHLAVQETKHKTEAEIRALFAPEGFVFLDSIKELL